MKLPTESRDLPPGQRWYRLAGPGAIMLATSLGSGEIYFWPNLSVSLGAWVLFIAFIAIGLQYVLNTEISRYTIATGETIIRGFNRLWRPLPWVILACCTIPWIWPGWSMGGATALSWLIGGDPVIYGVASLVLAGLLLSLGRTLYRSLEITQMFLIAFTILSSLVVFGYLRAYTVVPSMVTSFSEHSLADFAGTDIVIILSAFAFCGAGGTINLTQSHYVKEKGFGMGSFMPKLLNPLPFHKLLSILRPSQKQQQKVRVDGYVFQPDDENVRRWRAWWKEVRQEQYYNFFLIGCVALALLSLLAVNLVGNAEPQEKMALLAQEMEIIQQNSGFLSKIFALVVALVFFTSEVGILDHVCRLTADIMHTKGIVRDSSRWLSEGAMYLYTLWAMIIGGVVILLGLNIDQPPNLLVTAGVLSGIAIFIYSVAMVVLNVMAGREWRIRFVCKKDDFNPFNLPLWRWIALAASCILFGVFSVLAAAN